MDKIFYSLEKVTYEKNSMIFEKGSTANQVLFVLEGVIRLYMDVYDLDLQQKMGEIAQEEKDDKEYPHCDQIQE